MSDTKLLREKINNSGIKLVFIADKLGLSPQGLRNKLSNKSEFTASEIVSLCEILNIKSLKERESIFFARDVD